MKQINKKLLQHFNQPNTHLVISRWPSKKGSFDGIATYTQDTILKFSHHDPNAQFVVLAEALQGEPTFSQPKKNVLVVRIFNDKKMHLYPQVLQWLKIFSKVKTVYVHSEFCASGGPHLRVLLIPFLFLIRLTGRKIVYYAHNVVTDLSEFSTHFNLGNTISVVIMSYVLQAYFKILSLAVTSFVVLENHIAHRLASLVGNKKIIVQPHWIDSAKTKITQVEAKKRLGIQPKKMLVVSFGFVTYYKGADWLGQFAIQQQKKLKDCEFVLAGGMAYSLKSKKYYTDFYHSIENQTGTTNNFRVTGFLSENEIALWMSAADVIVFPYRSLMGGSGALQQALRFDKPVLFSQPMYQYLRSNNFEYGLQKLALKNSDISFSLEKPYQLTKLLTRLRENKQYRTQLLGYARTQKKRLSIKRLLPAHYSEVYQLSFDDKKTSNWLTKGLFWLKQQILPSFAYQQSKV